MKKLYLGSNRLNNYFKMIRIKYSSSQEVEDIKEGVMQLMSGYLQKYGGYTPTYHSKLINVVDLENCKELLVYFVTGPEAPHEGWEGYLKNTLLKNYNVIAGAIELGPKPN